MKEIFWTRVKIVCIFGIVYTVIAILICIPSWHSRNVAEQFIEEGYTVYLDGKAVNSDKIDLGNYSSIKYDTNKRELYISN